MALEIIRGQDGFTNPIEYITNLLTSNCTYANNLQQIQQNLWILDGPVIANIETGVTDNNWTDPVDHYSWLDNTISWIVLYATNPTLFNENNQQAQQFANQNNTGNIPVNYSMLPFSGTISNIENIQSLLTNQNLTPTDILSLPLNGGQVLSHQISNLNQQLQTLQTSTQMMNNITNQATLLQSQSDNQYIYSMNSAITSFRSIINSFISSTISPTTGTSTYIWQAPAIKSPVSTTNIVGLANNGGGYIQQLFQVNNGVWSPSSTILPCITNYGSQEVSNLTSFQIITYGPTQVSTTSTTGTTTVTTVNECLQTFINSSLSTNDQNLIDCFSNIYNGCYNMRENSLPGVSGFNIGTRFQLESMFTIPNLPNISASIQLQMSSLNLLRNSLIEQYLDKVC